MRYGDRKLAAKRRRITLTVKMPDEPSIYFHLAQEGSTLKEARFPEIPAAI